MKCSGCDYHLLPQDAVCSHLSYNDLTVVKLNTHSMNSLYLSITGKWILGGRFSIIINSDIFPCSETQQVLRLRNAFIVEESIRLTTIFQQIQAITIETS